MLAFSPFGAYGFHNTEYSNHSDDELEHGWYAEVIKPYPYCFWRGHPGTPHLHIVTANQVSTVDPITVHLIEDFSIKELFHSST